MNIKEKIQYDIQKALDALGVPKGMVEIGLEHPAELSFGDYSSNVAFVLSKQAGSAAEKSSRNGEKDRGRIHQ